MRRNKKRSIGFFASVPKEISTPILEQVDQGTYGLFQLTCKFFQNDVSHSRFAFLNCIKNEKTQLALKYRLLAAENLLTYASCTAIPAKEPNVDKRIPKYERVIKILISSIDLFESCIFEKCNNLIIVNDSFMPNYYQFVDFVYKLAKETLSKAWEADAIRGRGSDSAIGGYIKGKYIEDFVVYMEQRSYATEAGLATIQRRMV
jgi:hypothetical protein